VNISIETERESDNRWIAEVTSIPGVMAYGAMEKEAISKAYARALEVIAADARESQEAPKSIDVVLPRTA
jgi:predicted RNase H-like HicB family nuclease